MGEFQKRIIKRWENKTGMKFLAEHSFVPLHMYLAVVGDAKKEFEKLTEAYRLELDDKQYHIRIDSWFKKWFGMVNAEGE